MNGNSKFDAYYKEAERMYVRDGKTQKEIAEFLKISEKTISAWSAKDEWVRNRREFLTKTQIGPIEKLEGALERLVARLDAGELDENPKLADQLSKVMAVLDRLRGKRDPLGEAIVVMDRFGAYIKRVYPEVEFNSKVGDCIAGFFEEVRRGSM